MKKIVFITSVATVMVMSSCQKENLKNSSSNLIAQKIDAWLTSQQKGMKAGKKANVELLKENIDVSAITRESYINHDEFLVVPVKASFKTAMHVQTNHVVVLLFIMNGSGVITNGNLVEYIPDSTENISKIPRNTFSKMYHLEKLDCNGMFRFLSVAGRWLHQWQFKNGERYAYGAIEKKAPGNSNARTNMCYDTYLHTSYYVDGELLYETWEYLGSWCDDSTCNNVNLASLCDDHDGGNGAGEGDNCSAALEAFSDGVTTDETVAITTIFEDQAAGIRGKKYDWVFFKSSSDIWRFVSHDSGYHKKIGAQWQWQSFKHLGVTKEGWVVGGSVDCSGVIATPTLGLYWSAMTLSCQVTYTLVCEHFPISTSQNFTTTKFFHVDA